MSSAGKISPSIMCADFINLGEELRQFEKLKIEYLHIDIMDGVFVQNYTLGTDFFMITHLRKLKFLNIGENEVKITITNALRNLLGPHHMECGESFSVTPACFVKESELWNRLSPTWSDSYHFVKLGLN